MLKVQPLGDNDFLLTLDHKEMIMLEQLCRENVSNPSDALTDMMYHFFDQLPDFLQICGGQYGNPY